MSFGTAAPETLISATASLTHHTDMALGNVLGSIITNTLLGLGLAAIFRPLKVQNSTIWKEIPLLILSIVIVTIMANDVLIDGKESAQISRGEGLTLLGLFAIFLAYTAALTKGQKEKISGDIQIHTLNKSFMFTIIGLTGLVAGSRWVVQGAVHFAEILGIHQSIIGLTIIAIGTSLPEITTASVSSYKGHTDLAVGTIIGANLFNALWILGLSATLRPLNIVPIIHKTLLFCLFVVVLLLGVVTAKEKNKRVISRMEGFLFLLLYAIYMITILLQN